MELCLENTMLTISSLIYRPKEKLIYFLFVQLWTNVIYGAMLRKYNVNNFIIDISSKGKTN